MAETLPFDGVDLPLALGDCRLAALPAGPVRSVAPYPGQAAAVAAVLGGFPAPGEVLTAGDTRLVWAGREMAFAFGPLPEGLGGLAAVTAQSDGWAGLSLSGTDAGAVLARLVPLDVAGMQGAARTLLHSVPLLLIRAGAETIELWCFRSMAGTVVHELETAMRGVAARRDLAERG